MTQTAQTSRTEAHQGKTSPTLYLISVCHHLPGQWDSKDLHTCKAHR